MNNSVPPVLRHYFIAALLVASAFNALGQAELAFVAPSNNAVFKLGVEIPVQLSGYAPDDVFGSAELFTNGVYFASANFCCWLCQCPHPTPGITTTLQIPAPHDEELPSNPPWQGWTPAASGTYVLTARATGENGTVVESSPVTIRVDPLDLKLRVQLGADGALMFVLPEGSLVAGGFAMELSHNLKNWETLGTFDPGNVAAFFRDRPDSADERPRYYRAVRNP